MRYTRKPESKGNERFWAGVEVQIGANQRIGVCGRPRFEQLEEIATANATAIATALGAAKPARADN